MGSLLKISDAGALALHAAVYLAVNEGACCSAGAMADDLKVSQAHLIKVLQRLAQYGLVRAVRGRRGGYVLARPAETTRLRDFFEAIEGPLAPSECLLKHKACHGVCILGDRLRLINQEVSRYLTVVSVAEIARSVNWSPAVRKQESRTNSARKEQTKEN